MLALPPKGIRLQRLFLCRYQLIHIRFEKNYRERNIYSHSQGPVRSHFDVLVLVSKHLGIQAEDLS